MTENGTVFFQLISHIKKSKAGMGKPAIYTNNLDQCLFHVYFRYRRNDGVTYIDHQKQIPTWLTPFLIFIGMKLFLILRYMGTDNIPKDNNTIYSKQHLVNSIY